MPAAFALFGVYCIATPFCPNPTALIMLQILGGAAISIPNVLLFASAGRELAPSQQILAMGIFQTVYSVGMTVGPIVSGLIADAPGAGFTPMFYTLGGVSALGAIGALALYKNRSRD